MKCLKITSRKKVTQDISILNPECFISIKNPGVETLKIFEDFTGPKLELIFEDYINAEKTSPKYNHIFDLIDFANNHGEKTFVINCHAGISRSSACALILEFLPRSNNKNEEEIFTRLITNNPSIFPNEKIILMADDILKTNFKRVFDKFLPIMQYRFKMRYGLNYENSINSLSEKIKQKLNKTLDNFN